MQTRSRTRPSATVATSAVGPARGLPKRAAAVKVAVTPADPVAAAPRAAVPAASSSRPVRATRTATASTPAVAVEVSPLADVTNRTPAPAPSTKPVDTKARKPVRRAPSRKLASVSEDASAVHMDDVCASVAALSIEQREADPANKENEDVSSSTLPSAADTSIHVYIEEDGDSGLVEVPALPSSSLLLDVGVVPDDGPEENEGDRSEADDEGSDSDLETPVQRMPLVNNPKLSGFLPAGTISLNPSSANRELIAEAGDEGDAVDLHVSHGQLA